MLADDAETETETSETGNAPEQPIDIPVLRSPIVFLQSSDGIIIETDLGVANMSKTIKDQIDANTNRLRIFVEVPKVCANILQKVLTWCNVHKFDRIEGNGMVISNHQRISESDNSLLDVEPSMLHDLMDAADYLKIPGLLHLSFGIYMSTI